MAQTDEPPTARRDNDDLATVMAVGVLAYLGETLGHEALGHGGACLASGGAVTVLAPMWMRCSVTTIPIVLAGPAFNVLAAGLLFVLLRGSRRPFGSLSLYLWLSCALNLLVAAGYLVVGGATGFGDWPFIFASMQPALAWRVAAVGIGAVGYYAGLRVLAWLYGRRTGRGGLTGRTLWPGLAAAVVACAAEAVGGRLQPLPLVLALGCTAVVGWSLSRLGDFPGLKGSTGETTPRIGFNPAWIVAALAVACAFIVYVGPGLVLSR